MTSDKPKTLPEWQAYVAALEERALTQEARAMNSAGFVKALQREGYSAEQIHAIYIFFAKRLVERGAPLPQGGLYNFELLSKEEPPVLE